MQVSLVRVFIIIIINLLLLLLVSIVILKKYAETTLRLESLVGDLEDSASQTGPNDFRSKNEKFQSAIKSMEDIESIVVSLVMKNNNTTQRRTQTWARLIESVDSRVQSTLSMLKPQALRVHRSILSSINWPPPLASNTESSSAITVPELPNPLVLMCGDTKVQFSQSFLVLCALQHLQNRRESRKHQLNNSTGSLACDLDWNLWAIDELMSPLATRMEKHFCKWSEHPKFVFALVYKTSRDFLDGIETVLQPLIDRAKLVGCSVKETWIVSMVRMLSTYLTTRVFPELVIHCTTTMVDDDHEVISKWLNLIDLIISFDKRMMGLANTGILPKGMALPSDFTEESPLPMLLYSIFQNRKPWLQVWAEMELRDVEGKLKNKAESDTSWVIVTLSDDSLSSTTKSDVESELTMFMLSSREDFKAPPIVDSVIKISWTMIDRCRTLPSIELRLEFIKSSACVLLDWFYQVLIQRSERKTPEMNPNSDATTTVIMEDDMLVRLVTCINSAGYCESVMEEWSEDLSIIDLSQTHGLFKKEIKNMLKLETDCLEDIMSSLLLEFELFSRDYIRDSQRWEVTVTANDEQLEPDNISRLFMECLDMVTVRLRRLKSGLNSKDFADLWRSIALGLDHFIFNSIMLNKMKFSKLGIQQFTVDMKALFCVFRPFCVRPEAFFPYLSDYFRLLLSVSREESVFFTERLNMNDERIRDELLIIGVSHLSVKQVKKILHRRILDA